MAWSKKYDRCLRCGTQTYKHKGRGLCVYCYQSEIENSHKSHITGGLKERKIFAQISKNELELQYKVLEMSLSDLARKYNCTRQYIHKLMKKYGISRRDKATARELAQTRGKVVFNREDEFGNKARVIIQKNIINKDFFKSWSPAMAYVLGVLYTDGNLRAGIISDRTTEVISATSRFTVYQKEPELLQKILVLMRSNAKLLFRKKKGISGAIYYFHVNNNEIYEDLLRLGLSPNKSLSLVFPNIEPLYIRHFIRGCWDGDGTVYREDNDPAKPRASFISGSKLFTEKILKHLVGLGLSERRIYTTKSGRAFYFRFLGQDCAKLYHIFYDGVPESMYLTRKYERFKAIADYFQINTICKERK